MHWFVGPSFGKDVFAKRLCRFPVEDAFFHKGLKCIGIQYFRPEIAVISRRISAAEDVCKIGTSVARDNFGNESDFSIDSFSNLRTSKIAAAFGYANPYRARQRQPIR